MEIVEIRDPSKVIPEIKFAVGIDFGTTHSLIAISNNGKPLVIQDQASKMLVPSIVNIADDQIHIGERGNFHISIRSIKRLLGKTTAEVMQANYIPQTIKNLIDPTSKVPLLKIANKIYSPIFIAGEIFKYLKQQAENHLGQEVIEAVVSVPAYFDELARGHIILAANLAGLKVIRLIAEPTAAAYAYGLNKQVKGRYLVYDFGGGTFDVSLLNINDGIFQVLATKGDNALGGDDIDLLVAEYFAKINNDASENLVMLGKQAKEYLTNNKVFNSLEHQVSLTRIQLEEIIDSLIKKTLDIVEDVLEEAGDSAIEGIILVGGTTRIPMILNKLTTRFKLPVFKDIDPDQAVVWGAAMQAENLTYKGNNVLIDVLPLSIGIELYGGLVDHIMMRNNPLPLSVTKEFTTYADKQTAMKFHIVQGEREMADKCRSLGRFELGGLPLLAAGRVRIEITFSIDVDGILSVFAIEKASGVSNQIELKPREGIDNNIIDNMLEESYLNVHSDYNERITQEAIIETQSFVNNVKKVIEEIDDLSAQIRSEITLGVSMLNEAVISKNYESIIENNLKLKNLVEKILQPLLNKKVVDMLKGQNINQI